MILTKGPMHKICARGLVLTAPAASANPHSPSQPQLALVAP